MSLSPEAFTYSKDGTKWTPGQELDHIIQSVTPLNQALSVPKLLLKTQFGVANRPSRTYEGLVTRYRERLEGVTMEDNPFAGKVIDAQAREAACEKLSKKVDKLTQLASKQSEKDLETYVVPHPLLGKVTLREILYFTLYHVQHHEDNVRRNLAEFTPNQASS